jgi:hypothetical protein
MMMVMMEKQCVLEIEAGIVIVVSNCVCGVAHVLNLCVVDARPATKKERATFMKDAAPLKICRYCHKMV